MIDFIKKMIHKFRRLITYGIMGVINTIVDYIVFAVAYNLLDISAGVSQALGFLTGSVCGYLLNSNITFSEGKGRTKAQFAQYVGVDLVLGTLSSVVMEWLEGKGVNAYLIKIGLTAIVALLHYTIYKYLVFRIKKEDSEND